MTSEDPMVRGRALFNHAKAKHYPREDIAQRVADKVGAERGIVMEVYYCCRDGFRLKNLGYVAGKRPGEEATQ